jgi:tetratricopeptide (TPR) repeat protein
MVAQCILLGIVRNEAIFIRGGKFRWTLKFIGQSTSFANMKSLLVWLLAGCFPFTVYTQSISDHLVEMYEMENYHGAIELAIESDSLDLLSIYTLGLCYFQASENLLAIETFDQVIAKDPHAPGPWFFKAKSLLHTGNSMQALPCFRQAFRLNGQECDYVIGLASGYRATGQLDSALYYYQKALSMQACLESVYVDAGDTYEQQGHLDSALTIYYQGLRKLGASSPYYQELLYRIGVAEYLSGDLEQAERIFLKLITEFPEDMQFIPKLVQVYYAQEEYEKAISLKQRLYGAYQREELPDQFLEEGFCIDQFPWQDKRIFVFENLFDDTPAFSKYIFYLTNDNGTVLCQIQVEHHDELAQDGYFYTLGLTNREGHVPLRQYQFKEDVPYPELRSTIVRLLRQANRSERN